MRLCLFSALNDDISGHVRWIHRRILLAIASVLVFRKILPEKACKYASVFYKCAFGALKMMKKALWNRLTACTCLCQLDSSSKSKDGPYQCQSLLRTMNPGGHYFDKSLLLTVIYYSGLASVWKFKSLGESQ